MGGGRHDSGVLLGCKVLALREECLGCWEGDLWDSGNCVEEGSVGLFCWVGLD